MLEHLRNAKPVEQCQRNDVLVAFVTAHQDKHKNDLEVRLSGLHTLISAVGAS